MTIKTAIVAVLMLGTLSACENVTGAYERGAVSRQGVQLPEGIVLSPNDTAIWNNMSDAERQRAIQFLVNGGTVAGSVGGA
ncbi:hypothetical protein LGT41_0002030 [Abyssibius alkaniclasticus]|uniref:hypothetical protein n=1 Tax=Abyssibius alkaniclasticus TaxID=2881234 RepID=UPI002364997A|nr:hypothetical protein [Abyssibius alkaniclasticus]UPH71617.1 hypothetical protein LGT41_0002030 [Abyssibius alkaniclasticus]|tara:strand:+ start:1295 stop:1537 length:243 start_codon:yes stop_codon:yes gene_type:complete